MRPAAVPLSPALGTTYGGGDAALLERLLPLVEYIEIAPDSLAESHNGTVGFSRQTMEECRTIEASATIIVHGVGLSIGSYDGWCERYLQMLDQLFEQVKIAWHSEHLAYSMVEGEFLGTMLTLPRTEQVLDMVCERILVLQQRYGVPFLLEHAISLLPEYDSEYSQAGFLNALTERTGCGLILDAYNLECDAYNQGLDIGAFLAELRLEHVREIHLANGVNLRGFQLDVHSRLTRESTITLAEEVVARARGAVQVVTYELLREAVPALGHDAIVKELERLRPHFVEDSRGTRCHATSAA